MIFRKRKKESESPDVPPRKVFFCHIPKCAGTSVAEAMRQQLCSSSSRAFSIEREASQRAGEVISTSMMSVRETVLAYNLSIPRNEFGRGHVCCRPNLLKAFVPEWSFVTLLRNPVSRWISLFTFNTYKESDWYRISQPVDEFLSSSRGQAGGKVLLRYFSNMPFDYTGNVDEFVDEALDNLARFSLVGTVEHLDQWCRAFERAFGKQISIPKRNANPNRDAAEQIRCDDALMRRIEEVCAPDMQIYRRVVEKYSSSGV